MTDQVTIVTIESRYPQDTILFPISRGPYAGIDYLYVMPDRKGGYEVSRHKPTGERLNEYGTFKFDEALEKVKELKEEQSNRNCAAVTGNGRWGCE